MLSLRKLQKQLDIENSWDGRHIGYNVELNSLYEIAKGYPRYTEIELKQGQLLINNIPIFGDSRFIMEFLMSHPEFDDARLLIEQLEFDIVVNPHKYKG